MHFLPAEDVYSLVNYTSKIGKQMESCFRVKKLKKKETNHEKSLSSSVYYGIQGHQSPMK